MGHEYTNQEGLHSRIRGKDWWMVLFGRPEERKTGLPCQPVQSPRPGAHSGPGEPTVTEQFGKSGWILV